MWQVEAARNIADRDVKVIMLEKKNTVYVLGRNSSRNNGALVRATYAPKEVSYAPKEVNYAPKEVAFDSHHSDTVLVDIYGDNDKYISKNLLQCVVEDRKTDGCEQLICYVKNNLNSVSCSMQYESRDANMQEKYVLTPAEELVIKVADGIYVLKISYKGETKGSDVPDVKKSNSGRDIVGYFKSRSVSRNGFPSESTGPGGLQYGGNPGPRDANQAGAGDVSSSSGYNFEHEKYPREEYEKYPKEEYAKDFKEEYSEQAKTGKQRTPAAEKDLNHDIRSIQVMLSDCKNPPEVVSDVEQKPKKRIKTEKVKKSSDEQVAALVRTYAAIKSTDKTVDSQSQDATADVEIITRPFSIAPNHTDREQTKDESAPKVDFKGFKRRKNMLPKPETTEAPTETKVQKVAMHRYKDASIPTFKTMRDLKMDKHPAEVDSPGQQALFLKE